jgi:hypothetical protein
MVGPSDADRPRMPGDRTQSALSATGGKGGLGAAKGWPTRELTEVLTWPVRGRKLHQVHPEDYPMARIKTVSEEEARGIRKLALRFAKRRWGYVPGIAKVALVDLVVAGSLGGVYDYLHLRRSSPLTRLQREMLAVVVNGHVNGAP